MEKTQKLILTLIIATLVFSVISIVINLFILNNDVSLPARRASSAVDNAGELQLFVEGNPSDLGGSDGAS